MFSSKSFFSMILVNLEYWVNRSPVKRSKSEKWNSVCFYIEKYKLYFTFNIIFKLFRNTATCLVGTIRATIMIVPNNLTPLQS